MKGKPNKIIDVIKYLFVNKITIILFKFLCISLIPGFQSLAKPVWLYQVKLNYILLPGSGSSGQTTISTDVFIIIAAILIPAFFIILGFLLRSNKIIRQRKDQLKSITDNINEGLIVITPENNIRFINPIACEILGYRTEQLINNNYLRIFEFKRAGSILKKSDCPLTKVFSGKNTVYENNIILQTKVGKQIHVDLIINPIYKSRKEIEGALLIIRDLTDSITAEKNISHWKQRYEFVSTAANQVVYEHILSDNSIKWSRSIEKVFGYSTSELSGGYTQWKEKIHPDDREATVKASEESKLANRDFEAEYRFRKKNGEYVYIREKGVCITDETGKPARMLGIMQNISKQKLDEEEILKFKVVSDNANYGAAILDFNWNIIYINRYYAGLHGYKPSDLIGMNISALHNEEQMEHILNIIGIIKSIDILNAEEIWHCRRDGKVFPMLTNFQRIRDEKNHPLFIALTAIDMSDRKEFIKLIEEASKRYKTLVANVPGAVYRRLADANWTIKFISEEIYNISGYYPDEFLDNKAKAYAQIIYFDDRAVIGQETYLALHEKRSYNIEYRIRHSDGSVRWVMERGRGIYKDAENILYCDGVIIDITDMKNAERALLESEERLKTKLEYILSPEIDIGDFRLNDVIDIEKLQQIQDDFSGANEISSIILDSSGKSVTKPSSRSEIFEILWKSDEGRKLCFVQTVIDTESIKERPKPIINKCGSGCLMSASVPIIVGGIHLADWFIGPCRAGQASPVDLDDFANTIRIDSIRFNSAFEGTPVIAEEKFDKISELLMHVAQELSALSFNNIKLAKEITSRKEFENQLRKSEQELRDANASKDKFLSIIAHDLKSPLAALRSMLDLLNADLADFSESDVKEIIGEMDNSAKNVFELLEDLLSWSRAQTGKIQFNPDNIDVKMIIENTISLMKHAADKKNINLYSDVTESIICYADANMISTVLRNLVSNAIKFTLPAGEVGVKMVHHETFAEFSVNDSGIGISTENMDKLFKLDTHLTTLGTSQEKGTGLGLILCKEFIEANDGKIMVESHQGKGSSFKFTLPKAQNNNHNNH